MRSRHPAPLKATDALGRQPPSEHHRDTGIWIPVHSSEAVPEPVKMHGDEFSSADAAVAIEFAVGCCQPLTLGASVRRLHLSPIGVTGGRRVPGAGKSSSASHNNPFIECIKNSSFRSCFRFWCFLCLSGSLPTRLFHTAKDCLQWASLSESLKIPSRS